jgi:uncharacterized protein
MSSTIDTNVLLYASDTSSPHHATATRLLASLVGGPRLVHLFWPVVMGYLRISTHPAIFEAPLDPAQARDNVDQLLARPHVRTPGEGDGFWASYRAVVDSDVVRGNLVPDLHIVALMHQHGVASIWTWDRDFRRFSGITVLDPVDAP